MRNILAIFALTAVFSLTAFADGDLPTGNKNCSQSSCLAGGNQTIEKSVKTDSTTSDVLSFVQSWLAKIFG